MPPIIFPCGGQGQQACPPTNASETNDPLPVPESVIIHAALQMSEKAKEELRQLLAKKQ